MTEAEIKDAIRADMENKKTYPANHDGKCGYCTNIIVQGEPFIFVGGRKMCNDCQGDMSGFLEGL